MRTVISGHNSFYLRESWLNKIFHKVFKGNIENKIPISFFSASNLNNAIDTLGVGSMMVESIKFWTNTLKIVTKSEDKKDLELSEELKEIFLLDPYLENINSLWIIHSNFFLDPNEEVVIWKKAYSYPEGQLFTKELLEKKVELYCIEKEIKISDKTIKDTINIFFKTYSDNEKDEKNPEENIVSFFRKLYCLKKIDSQYKFRNISREEFSNYFIYYLLVKKLKENNLTNQISISQAYDFINTIIKISFLDFEKTIQYLELQGDVYVDRAAGLRNISITLDKYTIREIIRKTLESE